MTTRPFRTLRLSALALLAACGTGGTAPTLEPTEYTLIQAADSIPLPFGRMVRVGDQALLQLTGVRDSRCPTGVVCIWEGEALTSIAVHPPCLLEGCKAASLLLELHTVLQPRSGSGWGLRVQLLGVTPYPSSASSIEERQYIAWVRVTPAS